MAFDPTWYEISNAASGLLFIVLGVAVASVGARGPSNRAFALFAIGFGASMFVLNLFMGGAPRSPSDVTQAAVMVANSGLSIAAAAGLVWLGLALPKETGRNAHLRAGLLVASVYWIIVWVRNIKEGRLEEPVLFGAFLSLGLVTALMWGLALLMALRFAKAPPAESTGHALMGAALALYPAFWGGIQFGFRAERLDALAVLGLFVSLILPAFVTAGAWLATCMQVDAARARVARRVAWICLGAVLAGMFTAPFALNTEHWGYGASRVLAVGLLAFAIVRGQAPGIDAKLRLGVSRSTIAALFIAVFFLASEGAQLAFGRENPFVGLLAAGLLVFALAPLQRAAERIAETAVPSPRTRSAAAGAAAEAYRHGLRAAMRDGRLTRREERHLAELARTLGLDSVQALALREEVEMEPR